MKKQEDHYVAIMAGGIGSRFWPKSRTALPKQFLDILGLGRSLLQMTYDRFAQIVPEENILIVTNDAYAGLVKEQLPKITDNQILREPLRRNTAPCVAYAAHKINALNPNASLVVAPSDHLVMDAAGFQDVIGKGLDIVSKEESLLTLGIIPTRPDTGYGYIQYLESGNANDAKKVKTFTEKPTLEIAKQFINSGDFLWNSGIFIWHVKTIMKAFENHLSEVHDIFTEGEEKYNTSEEQAFINKAYTHCTNISIDYGIMEKANNVYVIPSEFGWSDLGTWESLYQHYEKDYLGNAVSGKDVMVVDAANNMVMAPNGKLVVLQGLNSYCVIDTDDVLLICKRENEQHIKQYTADVKKNKGDKYV